MTLIDKILIILWLISFCMIIGSLFYGFILACVGKFYPEVGLMIAFSGILTLIFHHLITN